MMRRILGLTVVMGIFFACSSVPDAGPVNSGLNLGLSSNNTNESAIPLGPQLGMTPTEVVNGFLRANSSPIGDYAVARQYLSSFIGFEWIPGNGIMVLNDGATLSQLSDSSVKVSGEISISLNRQLRPIGFTSDNTLELNFDLVNELGEWRIVNPPSVLILSRSDFYQRYQIKPIWFVNRDQTRLTPDFVAISLRSEPASQLVRALILGSSDWLKPNVVNLLSEELSGGMTEFQFTENTFRIDFNLDLLRLTNLQKTLLMSQLAQTLIGLPNIEVVNVTVGGQNLSLDGISNPLTLISDNWFGKQLGPAGPLYSLNKSGKLFQPQFNLALNSWLDNYPDVSEMAISPTEETLAAYISSANRLYFGPLNGPVKRINNPGQISNLNIDSNGVLWFLEKESSNLFAYENNKKYSAEFELNEDERLLQAEIGPDGVRIGTISQLPGRSLFKIHRLVKSSDQIQAKDPLLIATIDGEMRQLAWLRSTEVIVLANLPNQSQSVAIRINLGTGDGSVERLPTDTALIEADGMGSLLAITDSGDVWLRQRGTWRQSGTGKLATLPGS